MSAVIAYVLSLAVLIWYVAFDATVAFVTTLLTDVAGWVAATCGVSPFFVLLTNCGSALMRVAIYLVDIVCPWAVTYNVLVAAYNLFLGACVVRLVLFAYHQAWGAN